MCAGGGRDTRSSGERNRVARFSSKQAVFLHKKNFSSQQEFFLQSKINFFSQGKKCQVEGCSCTYCLPDKKMERLVIGICPPQKSLSGQIDNWSFFFRDIEIPSNILNVSVQALYYRVSQKDFLTECCWSHNAKMQLPLASTSCVWK